MLYKKINFRQIKNLNVKGKIIKFLEDNGEEYINVFSGKGFFKYNIKSSDQKEKDL